MSCFLLAVQENQIQNLGSVRLYFFGKCDSNDIYNDTKDAHFNQHSSFKHFFSTFLKNHVTLKTGLMTAENSALPS